MISRKWAGYLSPVYRCVFFPSDREDHSLEESGQAVRVMCVSSLPSFDFDWFPWFRFLFLLSFPVRRRLSLRQPWSWSLFYIPVLTIFSFLWSPVLPDLSVALMLDRLPNAWVGMTDLQTLTLCSVIDRKSMSEVLVAHIIQKAGPSSHFFSFFSHLSCPVILCSSFRVVSDINYTPREMESEKYSLQAVRPAGKPVLV